MKKEKNFQNNLELEEEIPPFSSEFVIDYFDEIERRFEEQSRRKGRVSKKWKDSMNDVIEDCENLRRKYLPKSDKSRVYDRVR
jgi:hypothetical protein